MGACRGHYKRYVGDRDVVGGYDFFSESKLRVSYQVAPPTLVFTLNLHHSKRSLERYCQLKNMKRRKNPSSALVQSVEKDETITKYFWASKSDSSILRHLERDYNIIFSYVYLLLLY